MGILVLPENIANQIAAGEVIDRPASIVKELIENCLDAQATNIEVQFQSGGTSFIQVTDNGFGMTPDDAVMCFKRHATSKLKTFEDLQNIHSFGFRGEAIPSIASIAKVNLITQHKDETLGTHVEVHGGQFIQQSPHPCSIGTNFTVEQLFYNVPARRKFLKTEATESAHIINCVRLYAIAHPQVHFKVVQDHRIVFSSPKCENLCDRIDELWPKRNTMRWLKVSAHQENLGLRGVICHPGEGFSGTQEIHTFLNKRPITSTFLLSVLRESYRGFLPPKTYPSAFLFLEIPEDEVDVNVHPAKREVRLKYELRVKNFIQNAIKQRLDAIGNEPLGITHKESLQQSFSEPLSKFKSVNDWISKDKINITKNHVKPEFITYMNKKDPNEINIRPSYKFVQKESTKEAFKFQFFTLWQNKYAFFNEDPHLLILNCQGAQKRIWYEHILKTLQQEDIGPLQTLLFPDNITLNDIQAACLYDAIDYLKLRKICLIEAISSHEFQLKAIPTWVPLDQIDLFVEQLIEKLINYGQNQSLKQLVEPLLQKIVQKRSFPSIESQDQVENLCKELNNCQNYITDLEGHPLWKRLFIEEFFK